MSQSTNEEAVIDEQIWRAWVQRGRQREQATSRTAVVLAGITFVLLVTAGTFYLLAGR